MRASHLRGGMDLGKALAEGLRQTSAGAVDGSLLALLTDGGSDRGESVLTQDRNKVRGGVEAGSASAEDGCVLRGRRCEPAAVARYRLSWYGPMRRRGWAATLLSDGALPMHSSFWMRLRRGEKIRRVRLEATVTAR